MELLRLRKRLVLAQRGHKLLQDKLEELMRRLIVLLKDIDRSREDFEKKNEILMRDLLYCRIMSSRENFQESISKIKQKVAISVSMMRIMNVRVPEFRLDEFTIDKEYDFFKTSAQLDFVVAGAKDYIQSLIKLAQLLKTLDILSFEIERTRRRVNALEYILIPSIQETVRFITHKLNELERGNLVRLMRVKEIVRSH
jgi:V/A-type H+-transporting ATPase subunit D